MSHLPSNLFLLILAVGILGTFLSWLLRTFRVSPGKPPAPPPLPPNLDETDLEPVRDALKRGNKIEAIKLYREMTGCDLKESKDAVEAMAP